MKKKIKLLVVTPYFYPESGGVANHTYNLYKRIAKKDFDIIIITSCEDKLIKEERVEGMKVYRLPYQFKISNTPISFKWKRQINGIIEKEKPSIINAHTPVVFISDITCNLANKLKIPFIIKYHHGGSMIKGKFLIDLFIWAYEKIFLKSLFKRSNYIITSSDFVSNNFMKGYKNKVVTITPAVDLDKFKPIQTNNKNNILFVGNLKKSEYYKGLNYLLESISLIKNKIKDINLIIVGEGDYIGHYKKLSKYLGIEENVSFLGKLQGKKLVEEYNSSSILVLPSLFDATPNVLLEAMACKKPVIGSNIGGIPYVIDDGVNGLLVPPKDHQALADAIIKILKNPQLAKKMGENGYKKVKENFTWDIQANKTIDIYTGVLKNEI